MKQTVLWRFLKSRDELLSGKLLELHALVTEWLSYIPATFPHYTRHTVAHSEQIIDQVSRLLFVDEDDKSPVLERLSPMEVYIICVSALLHDSGMVVSEEEKAEIVKSDEWIGWVRSDGPSKHWLLIQSMRHDAERTKDSQLHFKADILTRHLIAEFVRREHHTRAAKLVFSAQSELARFAFDDPVLLRTVADVCEAHGLPLSQLEDHSRFPDRRTIRGYQVNVRFVVAALRLGDLLDMSSDRACPLVMGAACPLPIESIAHWTQYQRIQHRLTAPDLIELTAECESQDEHRYLFDWCSWIVAELSATAPLANKWRRHQGWKVPTAAIEGPSPSIVVKPSANATYIPSEWSIQLDKAAVLSLLSGQLYESGLAFIRELIQNAVDATRCRLSRELESRGRDLPDYLVDADLRLRETMPITVALKEIKVKGEILEEDTVRHIISVTDFGIGMTRSVIERFFLQVGRSYYKTEEFRRSFRFTPTSRFGVGFLSCFGVSDHVVVETKPYDSSEAPLKLVLTGPASYVLTEKSTKDISGTEISVRIARPIKLDTIKNQIAAWFPALEFPIVIKNDSDVTVVNPLVFSHDGEMPVSGEENSYFFIRTIPFRKEGLMGNLFVFVQRFGSFERWDRYKWAHQTYREKYPAEYPPEIPRSILSFHGAAVPSPFRKESSFSEHVDMRGAQYEIAASRSHLYSRSAVPDHMQVIDSIWDSVLSEHISGSAGSFSRSWKYLNNLFLVRGSESFWRLQKCIPIVIDGVECNQSLDEIDRINEIAIRGVPDFLNIIGRDQNEYDPVSFGVPYIDSKNYQVLSREIRGRFMKGRSLARVEAMNSKEVMSIWSSSFQEQVLGSRQGSRLVLCEFPSEILAGAAVLPDISLGGGSVFAINSGHKIAEFIQSISTAVVDDNSPLTDWHWEHFLECIEKGISFDSNLKELKDFSFRLIEMDESFSDYFPVIDSISENSFLYRWSLRKNNFL